MNSNEIEQLLQNQNSADHGGGMVVCFGRSYRVFWKGQLCSPEWEQQGPAAAYLAMLKNGKRKPEYVHG